MGNAFSKFKNQILALYDQYIAAYGKSMKDGYRSNAFAPLVWYVVFPIIPLMLLVIFAKSEIVQIIAMVLVAGLIIFPLVMYVIILKKDPKLLQSEWYRLEDKKIDMVYKQGDANALPPSDSLTEIGSSDE